MKSQWDHDKEKMFEKFQTLKEKGSKITLQDLMSDKQTKEFNERMKKEKIDINLEDLNVTSFDKVEELVKKYFDKLSLSIKIQTIIMIDEFSFTFKFNNNYYYIQYDSDSVCMIINDGMEFDDSTAHEIGFYELENYM